MTTFKSHGDNWRPLTKRQALAYDTVLVIGASLLIGLCARVAVHLPFSPVPITGQTLAVLLAGAMLGSRRGSLAVLAHITQGLGGLPVFADGTAGLAHLLGPTGGYLAGFVLAAAITGWLAERGWGKHIPATLAAMLLGNAVIYALGLPWLAAFVGIRSTLALGLYPFIVGDVVKIALATLLLPVEWRVAKK